MSVMIADTPHSYIHNKPATHAVRPPEDKPPFRRNIGIGTIEVKTPIGIQKVFIGRSAFGGFCAATTLPSGSVWFETGRTGIKALMSLTERLQRTV